MENTTGGHGEDRMTSHGCVAVGSQWLQHENAPLIASAVLLTAAVAATDSTDEQPPKLEVVKLTRTQRT